MLGTRLIWSTEDLSTSFHHLDIDGALPGNLSGWWPSHNWNALIWNFWSYNVALNGSHFHCHGMDFARTASFPHSNIGNARPIHWTNNGWYAFLQYGRHASTEADPPHHTITTASPAGYPLHPSCRCALKSHLHSQDQYPLGCSFLLLRSSEDICLYQSTTMRSLYRAKNYVLLIWVFKGAGPIPETVLKKSAQERSRDPSPLVIPLLRWSQRTQCCITV